MKVVSLDFGGSTVDVCFWMDHRIQGLESYEREHVPTHSLKSFLTAIDFDFKGIDAFYVTGGKSRRFESVLHSISVIRVDEIEAIGRGGFYLGRMQDSTLDRVLVVSMGTGTCMVAAENERFEHVGGTGIGGGTFLSLCRLLLKRSDIQELIHLFKQGDLTKVDLTVGELVGGPIGRISADTTASNLGKLAFHREIDFTEADLALGLANLIGQTIATAACFAAQAHDLKTIVLIGKLTRIDPIVHLIRKVAELYGLTLLLPPQAAHGSAIGSRLHF